MPKSFTLAKPVLAALAAMLVAVPAASADDALVTPAPGSHNLASGGGWLAWSAPTAEGDFKLVLRSPDGTISEPAIPRFGAPVDPAFGSTGYAVDSRRLVVAYSRCEGTSAIAGCDVYELDTATGKEAKVPALATQAYSETAPSVAFGRYTFVRRGQGTRKGVFFYAPGRAARRVSTVLATETQFNGTRVAYVYRSSKGAGVIVRRVSGRGSVFVAASRLTATPRSLGITRYQATFLVGNQPFYTTRFGGSGGPHTPVTKQGTRELPASVDSVAIGSSTLQVRYLDADGVKSPNPNPFKP